ncbi:glycosyltransferase family 4 protein [Streptomyces sp. DSM 44917]|uniref:D-inositol 3-phosphate glycosyltransferase n=1 Tax=Streptomyces boetiae TaxID=3075541 RepID=A0ABU2L3F6_9ACTN|nr:glycosyltransferase family 4 protein [Streptomyces sp. DSM 44917]MDT0305848.1 glycosyltransferase family 4 protein [Streptomyces sp. DSM 44917]
MTERPLLIRYLLLHAYGMGGTIRTVITQANALAEAGHRVELVSVLRRRDQPHFDVDPRVRMSALADLRRPARQARAALAREAAGLPAGPLRRLGRWRAARRAEGPPRHIPRSEAGHRAVSRWIEEAVTGWMAGLQDGVLVTTRPALNLLSARFATGGVLRVGQEHVNLAAHRADLRAAIVRWYPRLDAVAVLTARDAEEYARRIPGLRVERVPNAVHSLRQKPSTCASHIAVAAGRLRPQKGFDLLIPAFGEAVAEFPDWQLRIFGAGDRHRQLRRLIDRHHLYNHVFLMGGTGRLDEEMAKASMFVLSSRHEGLPMVLLEAMSHGLPVVSFDCPTGPADVLTDGRDGVLVPPENVPALAAAMRRLMADETLRAELGDRALATVRAYSPEAVARQWEELFAELLGRAARV